MNTKIRRQIYKDAFQFIWIPVCIGTFISCLGGMLSVFCADILGEFADAVFTLNIAEGLDNVYTLVWALLVTIFLVPVLSFVEDAILVKQAMTHDRMVLGRFLDKKFAAAEKIDAGDMMERLDWDSNRLRIGLIELLAAIGMIPLTLVYLLINVLQISVMYTVIVLGVSLLKFFVPLMVKKLEKKYHKEESEYASVVRSYETEIADRPYLVTLFGLGKRYIHRLEGLYRTYFEKTKVKNIQLDVFVGAAKSFLDTFCVWVILLVGAYFVSKEWLSPGVVAAMVGYFAVFNKIVENINTIIQKTPILDNLVDRLLYFYEDAEAITGESPETFERIDITNLTFGYEEKQVLHSVSFSIEKGEKVVLCGKNGSGKSTILKILLGLACGYDGEIKVNGVNFLDVNIRGFRDLVAYAPQNPYLFKGTVLENIQIANKDADMSLIQELLERFEIKKLADVKLDFGGHELSGGEKQKISVIRAIIKNAPVIFMDEPENNLDSRALEEMEGLLRISNKTIVYVSHNERLMAYADRKVEL